LVVAALDLLVVATLGGGDLIRRLGVVHLMLQLIGNDARYAGRDLRPRRRTEAACAAGDRGRHMLERDRAIVGDRLGVAQLVHLLGVLPQRRLRYVVEPLERGAILALEIVALLRVLPARPRDIAVLIGADHVEHLLAELAVKARGVDGQVGISIVGRREWRRLADRVGRVLRGGVELFRRQDAAVVAAVVHHAAVVVAAMRR